MWNKFDRRRWLTASCDHDLEKRVCDLELELAIKRTKKIKGRQ